MDLVNLQQCLIDQIEKYTDLKCTDQDVISKQLEAPYIALNQYGPVNSLNGYAKFPVAIVHYQLKVVTEGGTPKFNPTAKAQCANIADFLRRLWFLDQPKYDLLDKGIKPLQPCQTDGLTAIYLVNFNQYQDVVDLTLAVDDPIDDNTASGNIKAVKANFTNHTIKKD